GGRIDDAVFFAISTLSSIPTLLLLIALIVALGRGPVQVCFAMGVTGWVSFARVIRGETLKLRELDYVAAARALGASEARILLRHILPNLMHLEVITFVLLFSGMVLTEAVLAFLGIGLDGSWGQMIDQARDELARDPIIFWNLAAASVALFGLILSVNFVGDAIRDILAARRVGENVCPPPPSSRCAPSSRRFPPRADAPRWWTASRCGSHRARCSRWSANRAAASR